jgi:hypothetical protein
MTGPLRKAPFGFRERFVYVVAGPDAHDKYGRHTARRPAPGQFEGLRHRVASLIDTVPWYRAAPVEWAKHRGPAVPFHPL